MRQRRAAGSVHGPEALFVIDPVPAWHMTADPAKWHGSS